MLSETNAGQCNLLFMQRINPKVGGGVQAHIHYSSLLETHCGP